MCGISGIAGLPSDQSRPRVETMCRLLRHRGPDDEGIYQSADVVLGHRRLSILDLSPAGHQPMQAAGRPAVLIFNGEIYNYRDLRADLEAHGHLFVSQSDTEVLLRGYLHYGRDILPRLAGMFAFAIHDAESGLLLLARDQTGIKPLYVWQKGSVLAFASELRALMGSGLPSRDLDAGALAETLMLESPLWGGTPFREVKCLEPGTFLQWQNGETTTHSFWKFPDESLESPIASEDLANITGGVVAEHLVSDVPLGLLLSGGIDSSALAAMAQPLSTSALRTFTVSLPTSPLDEAEFALSVSRHLGTEHQTFSMDQQELLNQLNGFMSAVDVPSTDGLNIYVISRIVRQAGVKVVLSGQGGDEAFGGYPTFRNVPFVSRWVRRCRILPRSLRRAASCFAAGSGGFGARAKMAAALIGADSMTGTYLILRSLLLPDQLKRLLSFELIDSLERDIPAAVARLEAGMPNGSNGHRVAFLDSRVYMHDTLLRVSDNFSMAHSLEMRVPFADRRIVEMASRIPQENRFSRRIPKPALLDQVRHLLPEKAWNRKKGAFNLPLGHWLTEPLSEEVESAIHETPLADRSLFRGEGITELYRRLKNKPDSIALGYAVWTILVLGRWLQEHYARPQLASG